MQNDWLLGWPGNDLTARRIRNDDGGVPARASTRPSTYSTASVPAWQDAGLEGVRWPDFWSAEAPEHEWLVEPILPRGRQIAIFGAQKLGKSLLALELSAALATGRSFMGRTRDPVTVAYIDWENTLGDVRERLTEMGYGPDDNLDRLHYILLPDLEPLNHFRGAQRVLRFVDDVKPDVVVLDTFCRATTGQESAADPFQEYYRLTGLPLKRRGVSVIRLDHAGKDDRTNMARGSSAKGDDVDIVWQLKRATSKKNDERLTLKRTASRMVWVPEAVPMVRLDGPLRHETPDKSESTGQDKRIRDLAAELDELNIPIETSQNKTEEMYRAHGYTATATLIRAACKYRRQQRTDNTVALDDSAERPLPAPPPPTSGETRK